MKTNEEIDLYLKPYTEDEWLNKVHEKKTRGSKQKYTIEPGLRFGRLVTIREVEGRFRYGDLHDRQKLRIRQVECRCDCGNVVVRDYAALPKILRRGQISSCGCYNGKKERTSKFVLDETISQMDVKDKVEVIKKLFLDGHSTAEVLKICGVKKNYAHSIKDKMGLVHRVVKTEIPINQKFNMLTVLGVGERTAKDKGRSIFVLCKCDCGTIKNLRLSRVLNEGTISCGCFQKEVSRKMMKELLVPNNVTHGDGRRGSKHNYLFDRWLCAKQRCYNVNDPRYSTYGARGIKFYDEWVNNYSAFKEYILTNLGEKPESKSNKRGDKYSLDRIDVSKGYEPGNLRWSDFKTQSNNKFLQSTGLTRPILKSQGKKLICTKTLRKIYMNHYNVEITKGKHIHHIDWDASNNNPLNLIEVSMGEHRWLHRMENMMLRKMGHYGVREVLNNVDWEEYDKVLKRNRPKKYK